jgi:phosphoribosyl 1,2-cyclic phosphate phosphodiesterase
LARIRFTILGCASSPGVPRPNGDWGACDPLEPKNRRQRASLLIERISDNDDARTTIVIDTGPDFRQQMLNAAVTHLDGVVYTHAHADHTHGIDDLRTFVLAQRQRIPVYADGKTLARLNQTFDYVFSRPKGSDYPPIVDGMTFETGDTISIGGQGGPITLTPFPLEHGSMSIKGFKIGNLAYCTDVSSFPERSLPHLQNLDVLIIGALQHEPHPSHLSLSQALDWIKRLAPRQAILTHMHTPLDYLTTLHNTPDNVQPAFDGMVIDYDHQNKKYIIAQ